MNFPFFPPDPECLDPGIRALVLYLIEHGYHTTGSGDGRNKASMGWESGTYGEIPHVVMESDLYFVGWEGLRLFELIRSTGCEDFFVQAEFIEIDGSLGVWLLVAGEGLYGLDPRSQP